MCAGINKINSNLNCRLKLNGTDLEDVDSFVYLGAKITWNNDSTVEIKRRIQLATGAYGELRTVWKDKGIRLEIKVQLLLTWVFLVFLRTHGPSQKQMQNISWHLRTDATDGSWELNSEIILQMKKSAQ